MNFSDAGRARADSNAAASIGTSTQAIDVEVTLLFVSFVILVLGAIIMLGQPIEFSQADLPW